MLFPHFWAGPVPWAGQAHSSCSLFHPLPQQLQPRGTAERVADWGKGQANSLNFRLNFSFSGGLKVNLQKWGKNKQLSPGQLFPKAHPLPGKTKIWATWLGGLCQQGRKSSTTPCKTWAKRRPTLALGLYVLSLVDCSHLGVTEALQVHSTITHSVPSGVRQVSKDEGTEHRRKQVRAKVDSQMWSSQKSLQKSTSKGQKQNSVFISFNFQKICWKVKESKC